jgi:hypothetical protein
MPHARSVSATGNTPSSCKFTSRIADHASEGEVVQSCCPENGRLLDIGKTDAGGRLPPAGVHQSI